MKAAILIYDGFDELDAIGPYEVFKNARKLGADLEVRLLTLSPAEEVTASHGLRVLPDGHLENNEGFDLVVVPGGGWNDHAESGAWGEVRRGDLPEAVERLHGSGATVAGVCTGGMILSAAGLTRGRPATTHHGAVEELRQQGADAVDARVVDDGDLVSAGGVTSGIDLALWIVEREWDLELAGEIAAEMEYKRHGGVYH